MVGIRPLTAADWPEVEEIYAQGIASRLATFETETPSWQQFDSGRLRDHRFGAADGDRVVGWAAFSPTSSRSCYAGVVEHSIYVSEDRQREGIGRALLDALIDSADAGGIWTIQTSIFPENEASIRLHESAGFRVVGRRERVAKLDGRQRDTVLLERRSPHVG